MKLINCLLGAVCCMAWACTERITVVDDDDGGGTGGTAGAGGNNTPLPEGPGQPPPPPPDGVTPDDGDGVSFGVSQMFYGGTDRNHSPNPQAWQSYGYNLDGLVSAAGDPNHCMPNSGGNPSVMDDGANGVDNAWGKSIMPLWLSLSNDFQEQANEQIARGDHTVLVSASGVGTAANYVGVDMRAYLGAPFGSVPAFNGTESWPIAPESLDNPADLGSAKWRFDQSYVTSDTLVTSPRNGTFEVLIPISSFGDAMRLPLSNAIITMSLSPDRDFASGGIIAGVISVEVLVAEMSRVAGSFSEEFCSGTTIESLNDQLRRAADILIDGTQDPNRVCDGISIGLGFDAVRFGLDSVGAASPPAPDPCGP